MTTYGEAIEAVAIMQAKLLRISATSHDAQVLSDCELALDEIGPLQSFLIKMQSKTPEGKAQTEKE